MTVKKVAILGAGNGGLTAAADLSERGFDVSLFELEEFKTNLEGVLKNGGIILEADGKSRFIEINNVTTDLEKAIDGAQIIMLTVPGFAIESFSEKLAPIVNDDQIILLNGAASMGCLRFNNKAKEIGINKDFKLVETNSLTYGTRAFPDEARVELSLRVKKIFLASYPKENLDQVFNSCKEIYSCFVKAEDIWHTTLENGNPEVHPGPSLLNAGRIDYSNGEFWLYKEGITEHTIKVLKAVESERMNIGKAFGFELEDAIQSRARRGYFTTEDGDLQQLFNTSPVFTKIKGPVSVNSRYFTEDISTGLVLWSDLGKVAGVPTPNIDSIITLGGSLLEVDFYEDGLTLKSLGLDSLSLDELKNIV